MTEDKFMGEIAEINSVLYEDLLEKITALCKGFLLITNQSMDKMCSFCRGVLILLQQLLSIIPRQVPA